jgi:hypothetical protein
MSEEAMAENEAQPVVKLRYALTNDGRVVHVTSIREGDTVTEAVFVDLGYVRASDDVDVGDLVTEGGFQKPEVQMDRVAAAREIDDAVAAIYTRFTRFEVEYTERESQAQAFKDGGYQGDMPKRVADFAVPAGKTAQEATDLILAQAAQLRTALDALSALRMRKYEVLAAATDSTAGQALQQILGEISAVGAGLS